MTPVERASHNRFQWPPALAHLFGRVPDQVLADRAGVSIATAVAARRRLKIAPYAPRRAPIEWTKDQIALLGTASDRAVAAELELDHRSVYRKRTMLGIPPFGPSKEVEGHRWSLAELALLGKRSDRHVARAVGVSHAAVAYKRDALGIAPFAPPPKRVKWPRKLEAKLGRVTDALLVRRLKVDKNTVRRKREALGIAPVKRSLKVVRTKALGRLLRLTNQEVRHHTGLSKKLITKLRVEYGVPAPDSRNRRWTPRWLKLLGRWSDAKLGRAMGLTAGAVWHKRSSLGIAACPRGRWRSTPR